jgi:mono/diheme cytochrome c family protein
VQQRAHLRARPAEDVGPLSQAANGEKAMKRLPIRGLASLVVVVALQGCVNDTSNDVDDSGGGPVTTDLTCVGCHTSRAMLEAALGDSVGKPVPPHVSGDG